MNKILRHIGEGLFKKDACLLAGISRETFYQWIKEGKQHAKDGKESLEREQHKGAVTGVPAGFLPRSSGARGAYSGKGARRTNRRALSGAGAIQFVYTYY
ncbi:MAG: hypothetical protein MI685_10835 [Chlorobiales bacterium]|nr:hypothetical protein [Chlorobiales bacterium]